MSKTPETKELVTDIIAGMRSEADYIEQSAKGSLKVGRTMAGTPFTEGDLEHALDHATRIRREADRLEAALKREKAAIEADALTVGGMVEASRKRELFTKTRKTDNSGAAIYTNDNSGDRAKLRKALENIAEAFFVGCDNRHYARLTESDYQIINTALAAPPRNCDLFGGDYKMLHTAWWDWTGSPSGKNPDGTLKLAFGKWLLALKR